MNNRTELDDWWERLDERTKTYLKKEPLWHDIDLVKAMLIGAAIGFFVGIGVGFEWGHEPAKQQNNYLVG